MSTDELDDLVHQKLDQLRGRLCGLVESWNVSEKQERAAIQLLKSLTYDTEKVIQRAIEDLEL